MPRLPLLALAALAPLSASTASAQGTHFSDVSDAMGVADVHVDGLETFGMGGGCAWLDYDVDGDEDLFVASAHGNHKLFRHDGAVFTDVTAGSGIVVPPGTSNNGVSCADFDNDGLVDVFLTNAGPNHMFRNLGDGTFQDVTSATGLGLSGKWSTSAAWADFDLDGDLELYVGNYIRILSFPYHRGYGNELFVNHLMEQGGPVPHFVDEAIRLGVNNVGRFGDPSPVYPFGAPVGDPTAGCTLSVATLDYDEDGDPDLHVGNDFGEFVIPDQLYRNRVELGFGMKFQDVSTRTGYDAKGLYNMGINGADYDHDGDWDLYMSNLGDNLLLENDGNHVFTDVAHEAGPVDGVNDAGTLKLTSWGTVWGDFDNDGWEDLLVMNGYIPAADFIDNDEDAPNTLWMNQKDGTFDRLDLPTSGILDHGATRGVGATDLENDGFLDFYIVNNGDATIWEVGDRSRLFRNNGTIGDPSNHWIELVLSGLRSNVQGIGSRVDAFVGGDVLKRQVLADPVYVSSGTRMVHFGLGSSPVVDRLEIHWPSGTTQVLLEVPGDQLHRIAEPPATLLSIESAPPGPGGAVRLELRVQSHVDRTTGALLEVELADPATGAVLGSAEVPAGLAPGESIVPVAISLDPARGSLAGLEANVRATLSASGARDEARGTVVVP